MKREAPTNIEKDLDRLLALIAENTCRILEAERTTIYLVDENGAGIVILGPDGSFLGRQLTMGWNEGQLYYPSQMCINEKAEVFIADRGNSRVQIFTLVK